jgi:hypothetical protein
MQSNLNLKEARLEKKFLRFVIFYTIEHVGCKSMEFGVN